MGQSLHDDVDILNIIIHCSLVIIRCSFVSIYYLWVLFTSIMYYNYWYY